MTDRYQANHDWERIARHVVQRQQIVLVIGAIDVGKSTFCRFLVEHGTAKGLIVGFVDADVGQSQIGPPTTIGLKLFEGEAFARENGSTFWNQGTNTSPLPDADALYFVGWTSPEHHLLQCVTGTRLMVDAALDADADFIVIDTTGYVEGAAATILKQHKIELVKPTHLICIHRSRELDSIVGCFEGFHTVQTHRLSPHKRVTSKSSEFRRKYRQSSFERYFSTCTQATLPFDQICGQRTPFFTGRQANEKELEILSQFVDDRVLYAEWGGRSLVLVTPDGLSNLIQARLKSHFSLRHLITETPEYFDRRLIGLLNTAGKTISIGMIDAADFHTRQLKIRCKVGAASEARVIQFGRYKEDYTG
ncbi:MAG: Clp1/GlmU family protein [Candidatus Poribacteria bacterium]|nr:Clp1/GlmU family protein [Candidatus Poribacteria bacterium]